MLQHILVPLDGSVLAETAVPHALELAQRTDSVLCLLRVVPEVPLILDVPAEIALVATQEAGHYLDAVANLLRDQGVPLLLAIQHGSPETKILDYASEVQASMIVMATHNRSGISRATVGSVTEAVVRRSSCPVLLVHGQPAKSEYHRILVPLDGTPGSEVILPVVARLAAIYHAEVIILHAVETPSASGNENYLRTVAGPLQQQGLQVTLVTGSGDPAERIEATVRQVQPDLIAMATHARLLFGQMLHGSVTQSILHHTGQPVLLYHYASMPVEVELPAGSVQKSDLKVS